ncbi:MAG: hypothetical protein ACKPKO_65310 [Candidatus Fonsibacter sp.]
MVLTDSTTAITIICNNFEPTTMNTDMIIKANTVFSRKYPYTYIIIWIIIQFILIRYFLSIFTGSEWIRIRIR